jgi:hypothetical protein
MTSQISESDNKVEQQDTIVAVLPEEDKKICADCTNLIGVRYATNEPRKYWRCGHPNNTGPSSAEETWRIDLVTGLKYRIFKIEDIYTVRLEHCKGDWWEKYVKREYSELQARDIDTIVGDEQKVFRKVSKRRLTDDDLNNL